jgi:radical SAM modification target selenobiotic family peptide
LNRLIASIFLARRHPIRQHLLHVPKAAFQGVSGAGEDPSRLLKERRRRMDEKQMKKFLAGLCLTGLLTGAGLAPANAQQSGQSG